MTRIEYAAKAHYESGSYSERWSMAQPDMREFHINRMVDALAAADAHDAANGVHRIILDEGTVERAARVLDPQAWDEYALIFVAFRQDPEDARASRRDHARETVRLVLAAAVKEDG